MRGFVRDEQGRPVANADLRLRSVGFSYGGATEFGHAAIYWQPPFARNFQWRHVQGGAAALVDDLPVGIPVYVRCGDGAPVRTILAAGEPGALDLRVPEDPPRLRYRLVDDQGRPLRGGLSSFEGETRLDGSRGELIVPVTAEWVFVRLRVDGEEWSCRPFPPPRIKAAGVHDQGDLVLVRSSTTEFCRGRVLDTAWQPVATTVELSDGTAVWATADTAADGTFRLCIGPWFFCPMDLKIRRHLLLTPVVAERGDQDLLLIVDPDRPVRSQIVGQLRGLRPLPPLQSIEVTARRPGDRRWACLTNLSYPGWFALPVEPGAWDVEVRQADGTVLLSVPGVTVGEHQVVAPPALQADLPAHLQAVRLRIRDRQGRACPVPPFHAWASADYQLVVPRGGATVDLPQVLQRLHVQGETVVRCEPVVVPVEVQGLPADSRWHFGLHLLAGDGPSLGEGVHLQAGRGQLFVPRGVPLRVELLAVRYQHLGQLLQPCEPVRIEGFAGEFELPADGELAPLQLSAPADLERQLASLDEAAAAGR